METVIVITGALGGFGRLTANALAKAGHTVYASMRETNSRNAAAVADILKWPRGGWRCPAGHPFSGALRRKRMPATPWQRHQRSCRYCGNTAISCRLVAGSDVNDSGR
jgi:NAD(P)-dependent dehydrogenase (short-subunit alcohol dehydrogenase family)